MPKLTAEQEEKLQQLYGEAEEISGFNADALRSMAMLSYGHRRDKEAMRLLSFAWGRNARYLWRAVQRWPHYFMTTDGQPPVPCDADAILSLFAAAQLPLEQSKMMFNEWEGKHLRAWQVRDRVEEFKQLKSRLNGGMADLRWKCSSARVSGFQENGTKKRFTIEWEGDPIFTPETWENLEITVSIRAKAENAE